jgi:pimeloyl-ACP methyl ester carboxylesterase
MLRLIALVVLAMSFVAGSEASEGARSRRTMVIVHGAWGGAWQFARIAPLLEEKGFDVRRVTLTGLGERSHLASATIGLGTHIQDVVNVLLFENLSDVILVGHSYGGMVITGVADRVPERIAKLVYLDAMLPNDGDSVMNLRGGGGVELAKMAKDGFLVPTWVRPGKPHPIDVPHPLKTFEDAISLKNPAREKIPGAYILTYDSGKRPLDDDFAAHAERARKRGWPVWEMEADHNPHWRVPQLTAELLTKSADSSAPPR